MSTENIVTGKFYRILKDATNDVWDRISFWTHADDVQTASGITLSNDLSTKDSKISATQNDFATIETTSVSTHAYVIGNMLVYNNQLYRVISAIAVGATLVPGTNIEAVSVGTLSNMLNTTTGKGFYFDVKDDTYGFYPTAAKTADEFIPFGGTGKPKFINLGQVSSFNIGQFYSDYQRYTDGMILVALKSVPNVSTATTSGSGGSVYMVGCSEGFSVTKSYDNTTGILSVSGVNQSITLRREDSGRIYEVRASVAQNFVYDVIFCFGTMTNLGKITTYDASSIQGYQNLTADNFIINVVSGPFARSSADKGDRTGTGYGFTVSKTYDNTTGQFTLSTNCVQTISNGAHSGSQSLEYNVWLVK